jgi:23S rRNA (cytosine1962-C5)-methyltransferase
MENIKIWTGEVAGYKLLDSGEKQKLEEVGGTRIVRTEPRAWWKKDLSEEDWKNTETDLEKVVDIGIENIKAKIKFKSGSKHIGIFPEQMGEWKWVKERITKYELRSANGEKENKKELNILNLFGYTGIATLVCAKAGAKVTHVDASKQSVDWARENQKLSSLENAPIRWIVDDVIKFVKKEAKQGKKYDAIIMDPPSYGKGPKGEIWKIEEKLPELLKTCREILSDRPFFVIFNMYSTELSSISVANLLADMTKGLNGSIESGELAIKQQNFYPDRGIGTDRLLPMSIFAIWSAK